MTAIQLDSCSARAFVRPVRVYREDTDAGGIVHYANHLQSLLAAGTGN